MRANKSATASQSDPRVLWCHDPADLAAENQLSLRSPGAIFSGAPPDVLVAWLAKHPEHQRLPLFFWGRSIPGDLARNLGGAVWQFWDDVDDGEGFREVVGPGSIMAARGSMISPTNKVDAVVASAESIARTLYRLGIVPRDRTIWEVGAGKSGGGLLAIGAASASEGPAVAVDDGQPGAFGPWVARVWGVRLRVVLGHGRL